MFIILYNKQFNLIPLYRHWQDLGYLIVYITGRPDMQQQRVLSWLSQHNFPHGLVSFADGLSTDFLAHKITYLKSLMQVKIINLILHEIMKYILHRLNFIFRIIK